ncbi:MAG: glycoside hydrolase, partial [Methylocystis sp.]|nr:glycoside hydrolase [Methylocystis sp.]
MKAWFGAALAAYIFASSHAYAADNGINYDPAHSGAYLAAQKANDVATMKKVVADDLTQIRTLGFSRVKTFYSTYCTINGQQCVSIAEL